MNDSEIIEVLGGVQAVARMLNIKPPSVYEWLMQGKGIPEYRLRELAGQIEIKSEGRFTRKTRWPEKYAFYWPELAEAQQILAQAAPESIAPAVVPGELPINRTELVEAVKAGLIKNPRQTVRRADDRKGVV